MYWVSSDWRSLLGRFFFWCGAVIEEASCWYLVTCGLIVMEQPSGDIWRPFVELYWRSPKVIFGDL